MLQLPSQLNPRISVMSFDSDSSEGEDFISYEHYSPRHRRLARESHLSGRRSNVPKPQNVVTNTEETIAASICEKPSTSSGGAITSQQQQHESFFNSSRYHYTRNVTSSSAYSTEENSPYNDNLVSTRFYSGSKAVATYSSSYERLVNSTGQLEFAENKPYGEGAIQAFGWIYPRETGEFISIVQEYTAPSNNKLSLAINSESGLLFTKYNSAGSVAFTVTGQEIELDSWNFIKFRFDSPDHLNNTDSTQAITYLADNLGNAISVTGTGPDYGFRYQTGSEGSAIIFGGGPDVNFFNWALPIAHTGDDFTRTGLDTTGSKGGRYQAVLKDTSLFTGEVTFTGFRNGEMLLGIGSTGEDYYFGCAMHNSYDSFPSLQGIVAFDNKPFKEVNNYSYRYDSSSIDQTFGTNLSPIRVGNGVPK